MNPDDIIDPDRVATATRRRMRQLQNDVMGMTGRDRNPADDQILDAVESAARERAKIAQQIAMERHQEVMIRIQEQGEGQDLLNQNKNPE